jgi:hypothetical protein
MTQNITAKHGINIALAMKGRDRFILQPPPVCFDAMTSDEIRAHAIKRGLAFRQTTRSASGRKGTREESSRICT